MPRQDLSHLLAKQNADCQAKIDALQARLDKASDLHNDYMQFYGESLRAISWTIKQMEGQPLTENLLKVYNQLQRHTAKAVAKEIFDKIKQDHGTEND
jgi:hypothetical protein